MTAVPFLVGVRRRGLGALAGFAAVTLLGLGVHLMPIVQAETDTTPTVITDAPTTATTSTTTTTFHS